MSVDVARCGGITLCDISATTSDVLDSIYKDADGDWRRIGALLEADFMGRACQIKQNGIYDWIMATKRTKSMSPRKVREGWWQVEPFIQMERKSPINNQWFTLTSGVSAAGTVDGVAYDYTALVASQGGITADPLWFPEKMRVYVLGKTDAGTATNTSYRIVSSALVNDKVRIYALSENAASNADPAKVTAPATGLLTRGTPNVARVEKHCTELPVLNTTSLVPFWIEETRYDLCEDSETLKFMELIRQNNPLYAKFLHVDSVERNKQVVENFQRAHAEAFFWNKPLANQTMAAWDQLEQIVFYSDDTEGGYTYLPFEGKCFGRRANAPGLYELHLECDRVRDLQNAVLNIPELVESLYTLQRVRQSNGLEAKTIEIITDQFYAKQLAQGFVRYFNASTEGTLRQVMNISVPGVQKGPFGFFYREFSLDYPAVNVRILTHEFFDDRVAAAKNASADLESAARVAWILEASTNYQATLGSFSVTNRTGNVQRLAEVNSNYLCVMDVPKESRKLNSVTYTNVAECPESSLLMENISSDVPEHTAKSGEYADLYGAAA